MRAGSWLGVRDVAGLAILALAASGTGCGGHDAPPGVSAQGSAETPRHLVLVTVDTLRADRLGTYGGPVATPHFDRLAREGLMALHATAHIPLTLPSHASLLTGRLPPQHGLRDNVAPPIPEDLPTLAQTLKAAGFRTGGFVSSVVLRAGTGLGRGFDVYDDEGEAAVHGGKGRFLGGLQRRGDLTLDAASKWIEGERREHASERLFLWIHLYDPHEPYEPPEPWASRYAGHEYDGEVAWTDELIGRLRDTLERQGLLDSTLLIVTGDHGEGLGDHDEVLHGYFVYESTLHVPLLARGPGIPPGLRLNDALGGIDLRPTVLGLLGVADPSPGPGRSLAGAWRGGAEPAEAPVYAESLQASIHFGWGELRVLREGRYKYIDAPRPELYDLEADPRETTNLVDRQGARAAALRETLREQMARIEPASGDGTTPTASAELREQLGALGYLGGGGTAPDPGADPKDKIQEFRRVNDAIRRGLIDLDSGEFAAAARAFQGLHEEGIDSFEVRYYLGRALVGLERFREALPHLEVAVALQPSLAEPWQVLADAQARLGNVAGALETLGRGRAAAPNDPGLPRRLAGLLRQSGRLAEAAEAFEAAIALRPEDASLRVQLGEVYRDLHRLGPAVEQLREAVRLDPEQSTYWNALGMVLGGIGDANAALSAFEEASKRDPKRAQYVYNAGLIHQRAGRRDQAIAAYRRALALDPGFDAAGDRLAEIGAGPPRFQEAPGPPS